MNCLRKGCNNKTTGGADECANCWEVRRRMEDFLKSTENIQWLVDTLRHGPLLILLTTTEHL